MLTPSTLQLTLHGAPTLHVDGRARPLEGLAALLVARLALQGPQPRAVLAAWLWPDASDARARANLRQRLLRLKALAGVEWLLGDSTLALSPQVQLAARDAGPGSELLSGVHVESADATAWLAELRAQQRQRVLGELGERLAAAEAAQRLDDALALARQQVAVEPLAEAYHRNLIRLHYLNHDAAQARAAFAQLSEVLQREFAAPPSSETLALMQLVAQSAPAARALQAPPRSWATALLRPPRLVGRTRELQALREAVAGHRALLLSGEAGMGKSRLLAEVMGEDPSQAMVKAQAGDAGVPYATLARLLRRVLHMRPAVSGAALAQLLPEQGPAPRERLQVQDAAQALLAQAQLTTVAVDDLHFADDASLDMFTALASGDALPGMAWLFTQRPGEGPARAMALREALQDAQALTLVALAPLDAAQLAELVRSLGLPDADAGDLGERLLRHTGGNPMFALETLKQMVLPTTAVTHAAPHATHAARALPQPASVGALIDRRLQQLSPSALGLARVAAIAGPDFSAELAEHVLARPAIALASDWAELEAAQVLKDNAFAHDLVLDAALRSVPGAVAVRVHAQCAAWLAAHGGEPARVARHWQAGGRAAEAASAFEQAAQRACLASRRNEEAALYEQAARCHAEVGDNERRFEALAARVSALISAKLDGAALAEAEALPAQAGNGLQQLRGLRVLADLLGQGGQMQRALEVASTGLALAERLAPGLSEKPAEHQRVREEQVRLAGPMAANLGKLGRVDEAYSVLLPLRAWVDGLADPEVLHLWHGYWANILGSMGRLRESVASHELSIVFAERCGRRDAVGAALLNLTVALRSMGQLSRAFDCSARALALMQDDPDDTTDRTLARLMHVRSQAEVGHYADALQTFALLMPKLEALALNSGRFWLLAAQSAWAGVWLQLGQYARAQQLLQAADADTPPWMRAGRRLLSVELAHAMGKGLPQASEAALGEALALSAGDVYRESGVAARALRVASAEEVLAQAPHWAAAARGHERFGVVQAVHVHQARAAHALGRHDEAAAAARAALSALDEGYAPEFMYLPELHLVAWRALAGAGAKAEAERALTAGADWVRQHALPQVPAPFIDSFLQRNPVNRELLAAAAALG